MIFPIRSERSSSIMKAPFASATPRPSAYEPLNLSQTRAPAIGLPVAASTTCPLIDFKDPGGGMSGFTSSHFADADSVRPFDFFHSREAKNLQDREGSLGNCISKLPHW